MLQIDSIAQVQSLLVLVRPVLIRLLLVPLLQASEHNNDANLKFPIVNLSYLFQLLLRACLLCEHIPFSINCTGSIRIGF